jgi:FixJ family two-component response regulator
MSESVTPSGSVNRPPAVWRANCLEQFELNGMFSKSESRPMESAGASNGTAATVCLLDDDPSVLKATSRLLHSAGMGVETFSDPYPFLDFAETHCPAVAVVDIIMPRMNGLEVQTRLRKVCPSTRVIILTSKDDPSVRSQALERGAFAFFLKPVDDEKFLAEIQAAVSRS